MSAVSSLELPMADASFVRFVQLMREKEIDR